MNATLSRFGSISLQKSMEVMIIIMLLFSVVRSSYAADPDPTKNVKNEILSKVLRICIIVFQAFAPK